MDPFDKMAENGTTQLQKAIFAQYIMMKKLFMELEEEREASTTAASAALSMIRKLQKEKEVERMEAWQYKRIAEEKINFSDRALEILKEAMQQKELEITYLRNQLQVYKHRLLDVGIDDCDIADEAITHNIPLFESKSVENLCHNIKRNLSLPALQLNKHFSDMDINRKDGVQSARSRLDCFMYNSSANELDEVCRDGNDFNTLETKKSFSTDMDSIEKHGEESNFPRSSILEQSHPMEEEASCSASSVVSHQRDICSEKAIQVGEDVENTLYCDQLKASCSDTEIGETTVHLTHDAEKLKTPERSKVAAEPSYTEGLMMESDFPLRVVPNERGSHGLSKLSATRKVGSMNNINRNVRISSGNSTPRAGVERTKSRLKRVQSEKMVELNDPRSSKEQIIMLNEVYEQLSMIESKMRPSGSQETPRNDQTLDSVMEAALSFSI